MEEDRNEPGKPDNDSWMSNEDRDKATKARLYQLFKSRDDLGMFYHFYPEERPKGFGMPPDRPRESDERER